MQGNQPGVFQEFDPTAEAGAIVKFWVDAGGLRILEVQTLKWDAPFLPAAAICCKMGTCVSQMGAWSGSNTSATESAENGLSLDQRET